MYSGACCSSVSPKRTLYVEFTKNCNAHCPFCSVHRGLGDLDPVILKECVDELVDAGAVDRVSITGGEPLIVRDSLQLNRLFDTLEQSGLEYSKKFKFLREKRCICVKKYINLKVK